MRLEGATAITPAERLFVVAPTLQGVHTRRLAAIAWWVPSAQLHAYGTEKSVVLGYRAALS
jgi:hypothetical protein